jgi:hypothetical protein
MPGRTFKAARLDSAAARDSDLRPGCDNDLPAPAVVGALQIWHEERPGFTSRKTGEASESLSHWQTKLWAEL